MKTTPLSFWASSIALLHVPGLHVLAEPTITSDPTAATTTATTSEEPSCTASLVTKLCDYPSPFRAVASSGRSHCWEWCNENQPCDFIIFLPHNPHLGDGTCWWYPGESFDESKGTTEGCGNPYLEVYDKPVCEGPSTTTSGACAATASPSAIASVCDYPTPDDDCWSTCTASSGAVDCLSQCAESDDCSYVVYNPRGETNSPYEPGTCWMYPDGEYNPEDAGTCGSEGPEQYVYENVCPKPSKASTSLSSSTPPSATGSDGDSATAEADGAEADRAEAGDIEDTASAPVALSLTGLLTVGLAMLL
ncbi:uncharacterized protein J7T54_005057 [Emericellopsis cladophorae]|uniref:Apple domain-containing protein n=1 Tax=Emericellopsis cladophorae TaxID=2686198 RepID=A0A9P9XVU8_9HYPO|nr:uncharacterized protein J7T54_005057 [Emericellopsis cladophorae]KAI6778533.1 hypothetical protein J7T54_005057 [Emericellopsis cladophorae]